MKKIKRLKRLIRAAKVLMINLIIFSLLQNPFIQSAMAATNSSGGFGAQDILTLANGALNIYGNYLGQKQQIIQQQIAAANNQKLMSQLSPACRKPDGTACFAGPAKFFPECTLPASMSNMPVNACNNATPEPAQISSMITYESIAQGWMNYYDQMSNEASNAPYAVGLRCLGDKEKAIDSQITEMMNSLQRLQDRLNQDKQVFRDNNKKLLEDMNTANDELFGASKNNLKIKTQDFAKYFSQSCQSVIGKDNLKGGTSGGLNGILQGLSSTNKAASDFNLNRNAIEDDLRRESQKITSAITSGGIDDWLNNGQTQTNIKSSKFPSMESVVKKQADELVTARQRINKELAKVGYTPPAMDSNFSVDMDAFMAGANDFFKKKYVNDCVTGADKGIAIPVDDILKALEQKSTHSEGTARDDYRIALKKILDSDAMIADKMDQIKALESNYPGMTVTYKDSTQNRVTETPYSLFMKTIDKCEQRYVQDDQFTSKGSNGVSYQQNVTRAKAALQELKNLNDSFSSKVTQAVTAQVLNCNGEAYKSGGDCSEESLKTTSDNFCISHASQCANDILGCYAEANNQVQTRKTKMENLAKKFNANVASMIARSNALYEQQKAAVTNMTKLIQSRFPGTNFEIPKDMFVSMPELKKDTYGVEMAGDGDLKSFLDGEGSMPAKIDKLKQMFKMQKDEVKKATDDYIALQKESMTKERGRWNDLYSQCKSMIDASSKALTAQNNENAKKQAEEDANVAKFCKKYDSIRQNPLGACNKAKDLADIADQVQSRLSNQALAMTEQFASACDGFNNESNSTTVDCSYKEGKEKENCLKMQSAQIAKNSSGSGSGGGVKPIKLSSICKKTSDGYTKDSDLIAAAIKKLPSGDQEKLSGISKMDDLVAKIEKEGINDNGFFSDLNDFAQDSSSKGSVCEKIKSKLEGSKADLDNKDNLQKELSKATTDNDKKYYQDKIAEIDKKFSESKSSLDDILVEIASVTSPPDQTSKDFQTAEIKRIGEQAEGPCDMQNNSSLAKGPNGFDLGSFDQRVLGSSK